MMTYYTELFISALRFSLKILFQSYCLSPRVTCYIIGLKSVHRSLYVLYPQYRQLAFLLCTAAGACQLLWASSLAGKSASSLCRSVLDDISFLFESFGCFQLYSLPQPPKIYDWLRLCSPFQLLSCLPSISKLQPYWSWLSYLNVTNFLPLRSFLEESSNYWLLIFEVPA